MCPVQANQVALQSVQARNVEMRRQDRQRLMGQSRGAIHERPAVADSAAPATRDFPLMLLLK